MFVAKDFALYPFLRPAYEVRPEPGPAHLLGERGVAVEDLAPAGYVRVRGEMWMAEAASGAPLPSGTAVRVAAVRGNTLIVEPAAGLTSSSGPPRTP